MNKMNNYPILHGLEYEIQLMAEVVGQLMIVSAKEFLWNSNKLLFRNITNCLNFDIGNIEISTPPCSSYKIAVESANHILINELIPYLIKDIGLKKFALFLPNPMCNLVIETLPYIKKGKLYYKEIIKKTNVSCLKHWNISFPVDVLSESYKWKYSLHFLFKKGYQIQYKDSCRVHIKIPYH